MLLLKDFFFVNTMLLDLTTLNHPVHILDIDKQISPSAFIPFCEFGGEMSAMGVEIDQFDVPVCNSFQAKVLNDQLCYEVDLNKYVKKDNIDKAFKFGFAMILDYNEDRQVTFDEDTNRYEDGFGLVKTMSASEDHKHAFVYLDTIGKFSILN